MIDLVFYLSLTLWESILAGGGGSRRLWESGQGVQHLVGGHDFIVIVIVIVIIINIDSIIIIIIIVILVASIAIIGITWAKSE